MRALLIEDDANKVEQIGGFVRSTYPNWDLVTKRSFQSGLKEAITNLPDIILLDMTMSSYEVGPRETGGRDRRYAGREVLRQISRRQIEVHVIVITQYEQFEENGEIVTLSELVTQLKVDYSSNFVDAIFYQASNNSWMEALKALLNKLQRGVAK